MPETSFHFAEVVLPQSGLDDFVEGDLESGAEFHREKLYDFVNRSEIVYVEPESDAVWRFGQCEIHDGLIIGKFGKNFTEEQTTWDSEKEDYVEERQEVEVADVSHFIIFPSYPGIAFNRKQRIGPNQFRDAFVGGFENVDDIGGEIEVNLLRTGGEYTFDEVASRVNRVFAVDFELEPTNPYPDEDMAILDNHIHDMNADEFELEAETKEGELNTDEDFIRSGAAMSDVGDYGDYIIKYEDDEGEEHEYNSRGERATEEVDEPEALHDLVTVIPNLSNRLRGLLYTDDSENNGGDG